MIKLTFENINELFYDKNVHKLFPEFANSFNKWIIGNKTGIEVLKKEAVLEFIKDISEEQLEKLSIYLKSPVALINLDSSIVKNTQCNLETINEKLLDSYNLCITREGDEVYMTYWR